MHVLSFYPLFIYCITSIFLNFTVGQLSTFLMIFLLSFSFFSGITIFVENVLDNFVSYMNLHSWFNSLFIHFNLELLFDNLSTIMFLTVALVSFCVHLFSMCYMKDYQNYVKFFIYLVLFSLIYHVLIHIFFKLILYRSYFYLISIYLNTIFFDACRLFCPLLFWRNNGVCTFNFIKLKIIKQA